MKEKNNIIQRSFRTRQEVWDQARERAKREGTTASTAVTQLLEGYAYGHYSLPELTVVKHYNTGEEQ